MAQVQFPIPPYRTAYLVLRSSFQGTCCPLLATIYTLCICIHKGSNSQIHLKKWRIQDRPYKVALLQVWVSEHRPSRQSPSPPEKQGCFKSGKCYYWEIPEFKVLFGQVWWPTHVAEAGELLGARNSEVSLSSLAEGIHYEISAELRRASFWAQKNNY